MAVLVLGGAGYIGSHTVYELIDAGRDVVVADNLMTGFRAAVHPKARFYQVDIRNRGEIDALFEKESIEGVIHFAASSQVGESMTDPLKYYDNNLSGTLVLLQSMVAHGVDKIVFSSSAATYGEPEQIPILESDRTQPTNCYGETKLAVERMMSWTSEAHGLRYVALRYFNACGAHPTAAIGEAHEPETHLIPLIFQVPAGRRGKVYIFGDDYPTRDGTCVRDYIHVTDLAQAHILALDYLMGGGRSDVFNLGNGVGFTVKEVIETVRTVTGCPIPAEIAPRRGGDPAQLVASSEKARRVLGWKPQYADMKAIIATAWEWHKSHPDGFGAQNQ
ncbi:MAG: UDP-glucose 4-epimerase GalE [Ruminococcaceae bacterium]|nr:UDP-glucose 4-epimerase GalE [Oscillospiraceae bacterium]